VMRHPDVVVAKTDSAVYQLNPTMRFYDGFAAERSLVPSAAATV
jgi:hypothetical protein